MEKKIITNHAKQAIIISGELPISNITIKLVKEKQPEITKLLIKQKTCEKFYIFPSFKNNRTNTTIY